MKTLATIVSVAVIALSTLSGCGSLHQATQVVHDIHQYSTYRQNIQYNSIPVPVTVTETKEVRYIPWWSKALSWVGVIGLFFIIAKLYRILK